MLIQDIRMGPVALLVDAEEEESLVERVRRMSEEGEKTRAALAREMWRAELVPKMEHAAREGARTTMFSVPDKALIAVLAGLAKAEGFDVTYDANEGYPALSGWLKVRW